MEIKTEQFSEVAKKALESAQSYAFLKLRANFVHKRRETALSTFPDAAAAQTYGAAIRREAIARLPELLEEFEKNALANGARVFWARNAKEANEYIVQLAKERGIEYVTKGKSMVTEELGLNEALEKNGVKAWETDLGEFIIQLLHLPPFHIVGPAINVSVEKVRDLFIEKINLKEPTLDPAQLGYAARLFLRDKFHRVRMGITGVNMAVAETGTLINVENEGNIRFSKSSPRTQISVMSLEKVVPTLEDALHLVRLLCRNCTGQKLSAYVSMDNSPKKNDEMDGPEELIIIIVDNGRSKIYQDRRARDAMRCIRCGACLNICPVYNNVGGYTYGWPISGPTGAMLAPQILGTKAAGALPFASTLCGACNDICPVKIPITEILLHLRRRVVEGDAIEGPVAPAVLRAGAQAGSVALRTPWLYRLGSQLLKIAQAPFRRDGWLPKLPPPLNRWTMARPFPAFASDFRGWWRTQRGQR